MGPRRFMFVAALVGALGCFGDKGVGLAVPTVMAVGAYGPVGFGDACMGSKADLCSPETVQRIESITIDPPGMLEIVTVDQVPADLLKAAAYTTAYAAHALAPGSGQVCIQGLFSDGTHRKACAPAAVGEVAHVTTTFFCDLLDDGVVPAPLIAPGATVQFHVGYQAADGTPLGGDFLHPIDDGALTLLWAENYLWSAPTGGGSLTFGSPLDPAFSQTLSTYAPTEVTAIHAAFDGGPPSILGPNFSVFVLIAADVGSRRACIPPALSTRTDTPDVCTGQGGATTWLENAGAYQDPYTPVSAGTCHLAFSVPGGTGDVGALEFSYSFDQVMPGSPG